MPAAASLPPIDPCRVPLGDHDAQAAAAALGLAISAACLPGVLANLALLDHHAASFLSRTEPA